MDVLLISCLEEGGTGIAHSDKATGWMTQGWRFDSRQVQEVFASAEHAHWLQVPPSLLFSGYWGSFLGFKAIAAWSYLPLSNVRLDSEWSCIPTPPYAFLTWIGTTFLYVTVRHNMNMSLYVSLVKTSRLWSAKTEFSTVQNAWKQANFPQFRTPENKPIFHSSERLKTSRFSTVQNAWKQADFPQFRTPENKSIFHSSDRLKTSQFSTVQNAWKQASFPQFSTPENKPVFHSSVRLKTSQFSTVQNAWKQASFSRLFFVCAYV
jgi:hypothetical protein